MLQLSDTYCEVPFIVHEFTTQACSPEPECILPRARLYRVRLAPDQLNPEGHYDADLSRVRQTVHAVHAASAPVQHPSTELDIIPRAHHEGDVFELGTPGSDCLAAPDLVNPKGPVYKRSSGGDSTPCQPHCAS